MRGLAPIALFAFRRPIHTRKTLEALQADPLAAKSDLTIYADAAKTRAQEADVREVRVLVREPWRFGSVRVVERESNYGLSKSITQGVGELCAGNGRVIVVEDDITVAPGFLRFMNDGLDRYEAEERVMQVSGYMYPGASRSKKAIFLPLTSCWGWATWRRAWNHYDPAAGGFDNLQTDATLRRRFNLDGAYDYYGMLKHQLGGKVDSWGVRWYLSVFLRDGLVLHPPVTLVENIGIDGSGTHGGSPSELQMRPATERAEMVSGLEFPLGISVDEKEFARVKRMLHAFQPSLIRRLAWAGAALARRSFLQS
ncbi:MAG: glycosyltransferase family 2 protein [Pseudolabrys sp.]